MKSLAHLKREVIIRRLECEALQAAGMLEHPNNIPVTLNPRLRAFLKLAGEFYRGEREPTPQVRAIAQAILANARRINGVASPTNLGRPN
jgi:hypothetical protein